MDTKDFREAQKAARWNERGAGAIKALTRMFVCALAFSVASVTSAAQNPTRPAQAPMIFTGTITQMHATTWRGLPASDRTMIVQVDKVLKGPELFYGFEGVKITLEAKDPTTLCAGIHATFFTYSESWGTGLEVAEIAHYEDGTPMPRFRRPRTTPTPD